MKNFYLLDYLNDISCIDSEKFELLKHELDKHIYSYGDHLINNKENKDTNKIKNNLRDLIEFLFFLFPNKIKIKDNTVISNAYFNFSNELLRIGYNPLLSPWKWRPLKSFLFSPLYDKKLIFSIKKINNKLKKSSFLDLIDNSFLDEIENIKAFFIDYFSNENIKAFFAPFDLPFFERLLIKVFKELNKPSFICVHGLSGAYSKSDDTSADFLIVFGEKIKEDYIKIGVNKDKIFVSGHPFYKEDRSKSKLRFSLDNILVLTKVTHGFPWSIEGKGVFIDRGRSILYLYSIQNVLKKLGVKSVRFRPHPSENTSWYMKFIDKNFFIIDNTTLIDSLNKSSLVIGPSSTVFIESLYYGSNYVIYEPTIEKKDIIDFELLSPFDGSDSRIIIAKNEYELKTIIKEKICSDMSFFGDYIKTPFDINFIKDLI